MSEIGVPRVVGSRLNPRRISALTWIALGVAGLAFAVRLASVLRGGGLFGVSDYDGAVYFTGADSLIFGRVPYRDFVLLHPPGILIVLAPFAALGRLTSDPTGFAVARVFFMFLGAVNALLLTRLAGRLGLVAAAVAGLFYASWYPSMYAERTTLLEPLGTTALLIALLILFTTRPIPGRGELLAGAVLGLAAAVKIWGVIPLLVVVLWQLHAKGWRASSRVAAGAVISTVVVCLPFFLLAPREMFRMVVLDQIGRPVNNGSIVTRLASITSLDIHASHLGRGSLELAVSALIILTAAAAILVWRQRSTRILVVLLVSTGLVLLASPSYYRHYGEFVAAPLALTIAGAAQRLVGWSGLRHGSVRVVTIPAICVPLMILLSYAPRTEFGTQFPWAGKAVAEHVAGCVVSDDPSALIELNLLSSDLRRSCHVWVDATGLTYDRAARVAPDGRKVSQVHNRIWQRDLMQYFDSAAGMVILKHPTSVLTHRNLKQITKLPLLVSTRYYRIFGRVELTPYG